MRKTLLAMGAHVDDCVFGVPGILLKAIKRGDRVVILTLISAGDAVAESTTAICREYGAELRYLDFAHQRIEVRPDTIRKVAEVVADVEPDIALLLWPHDHHHDHEVASELCRIPLRQSHRIVENGAFKLPAAFYAYDNGPGHTIGFEPDTYVDISEEWPEVTTWLGRMMAAADGQVYDPARSHFLLEVKDVMARYRGYACGARYAEAICSLVSHPQDIFS
ncbi:MAG: PIG-L deacetylase family protein [Armatimonadota bacterium]